MSEKRSGAPPWLASPANHGNPVSAVIISKRTALPAWLDAGQQFFDSTSQTFFPSALAKRAEMWYNNTSASQRCVRSGQESRRGWPAKANRGGFVPFSPALLPPFLESKLRARFSGRGHFPQFSILDWRFPICRDPESGKSAIGNLFNGDHAPIPPHDIRNNFPLVGRSKLL